MVYCRNCGATINEKAVICPHCGVQQQRENEDKGSIGYGILGFFIPIVGFILFVLWYDTRPKSAKYSAIGGLIWVLLCALYALFTAF